MKHWVTYPLVQGPYAPELMTGAAMATFARAAEEAGFDGIGLTDHPAPSHKWLQGGGHDALDPFAAFAFVAAVTERLRLIPNILVLPYRNPFVVAKAVATIDALSGGRFTLSVATGYLRSEYRALGVDFEQRNAIFDESIEVLRGIWSTDDFHYAGHDFVAGGLSSNPKPASVPIWIGGNSKLSRRRVATYGDGWNPFPAPRVLATTSKTLPLETVEDLSGMLDELWRYVDDAGRDRSTIDVAYQTSKGGSPGSDSFDGSACLEGLDEIARLGVTWAGIVVPGDSLAHAVEALQRYGETVINAG